MPVAEKPWFTSKTVIVNALGLIAFAFALVAQNAGALQLDPRWVIAAAMAALFVNEALRLVTSVPIAGTPAAAAAAKQTSVFPPAPLGALTADELARQIQLLRTERDHMTDVLAAAAQAATPTSPTPATPPV